MKEALTEFFKICIVVLLALIFLPLCLLCDMSTASSSWIGMHLLEILVKAARWSGADVEDVDWTNPGGGEE